MPRTALARLSLVESVARLRLSRRQDRIEKLIGLVVQRLVLVLIEPGLLEHGALHSGQDDERLALEVQSVGSRYSSPNSSRMREI